MSLSDVVFIVIALITIVAALGVVGLKNIVHSALSLVLSFLGVAAIYFQLEAGFLGLVQILVYAGAISVLVIFAIMLVMDKDPNETNPSHHRQKYYGGFIAFLVTLGLGTAIYNTIWPVSLTSLPEDGVGELAQLLMGDYVVAFEVAAILLLVAVVGAIILAKGAGQND
ncbi:MAG: NADH-quinone oxidoreductase subunit J [Syntrophomonadaceae bacterium]|jgi:NADH:ubiquinone oxidoreductase subunit 6 (subunit J)